MASIIVLGPQRQDVNLGEALNKLDGDGDLAVISAGWQEGEGDLDALQEVARCRLIDLHLYRRADTLFENDAWLKEQYRARQEKLIELQRLYRVRLPRYMQAARDLLQETGDGTLLRLEQRQAISQQRTLDRHHLRRIAAINAEFSSQLEDRPLPVLRDNREEILQMLASCRAVLITGGNVAVLLNRLQLFDVGSQLKGRNVIAWSAGAMVLTERVVLFHDNTPEGDRDAEIFNEGLGMVGGVVFLPDTKHRLKTNDRDRLALMSRRFAPATCMTLDNGSMLHYTDDRLIAADNVRRLARSGSMRKVLRQ